jgi:hypothetical protein
MLIACQPVQKKWIKLTFYTLVHSVVLTTQMQGKPEDFSRGFSAEQGAKLGVPLSTGGHKLRKGVASHCPNPELKFD